MLYTESDINSLIRLMDWVEKWQIQSGMNDTEEIAESFFNSSLLQCNDNHPARDVLLRQMDFLTRGLYTGFDGFVIPDITEIVLEPLVKELISKGWDRRLKQVKMKFGTLRFYIEDMTKEPLI
ncbi:MAG: hypothetical protein MH321_11450 [Leptospiraceae bacterium]|nr:hypothetical protein [Leptospiraceae bacterium]